MQVGDSRLDFVYRGRTLIEVKCPLDALPLGGDGGEDSRAPNARLLAAVYLELKGGRERSLELVAQAKTAVFGTLRENAYGPRPRPLPLRSTDAERAAHAAFVLQQVKSELWKKLGV